MKRKSAAVTQSAKGPVAIAPTQKNHRLLSSGALFDGMQILYDSIARRAFESFKVCGRVDDHDVDRWFTEELELLYPIFPDMTESDDEATVPAEVRGFAVREPEWDLQPRPLLIPGKREVDEERRGKKAIYRTLLQPNLSCN